MPKHSLVLYDSEDSEDEDLPTLKKTKTVLSSDNKLAERTQESDSTCLNGPVPTTTTTVPDEPRQQNFEQKYNECNQRLIIAEKTIKNLLKELLENAKAKQKQYECEKRVNILQKENQKLTQDVEDERSKYFDVLKKLETEKNKCLEVSEKLDKLEKNVETILKDMVEKKMRQNKKEFDEYKAVAEKFIAKADSEKEEESRRADLAEAKAEKMEVVIENLQVQIDSLKVVAELKNVEMRKLQAAYNNTLLAVTPSTSVYNGPQSIPQSNITTASKQYDTQKERRRIHEEAKLMFYEWRKNYVKNKNSTTEHEMSKLKETLEKREKEKRTEVRNALVKDQRIASLENERTNQLATIGKQNAKIFDLEKKLNEYVKKEEQQKKDTATKMMREISSLKENVTELMNTRNIISSSNHGRCSSTATTAAAASFGPKWKVSRSTCDSIWKKCSKRIKPFLEEYTERLFSLSEQLLPEKCLEDVDKWQEVKAILQHFSTSNDENIVEDNLETFKDVLNGKRYQTRQKIYRNCSTDRLCAVTSNDEIFYYFVDENDEEFYLPFSDLDGKRQLEYKVFEKNFSAFGIPKVYQSCSFIVIVKDDGDVQSIFRMDCSNGVAKKVFERKKNGFRARSVEHF